jgi:hypothetical protein
LKHSIRAKPAIATAVIAALILTAPEKADAGSFTLIDRHAASCLTTPYFGSWFLAALKGDGLRNIAQLSKEHSLPSKTRENLGQILALLGHAHDMPYLAILESSLCGRGSDAERQRLVSELEQRNIAYHFEDNLDVDGFGQALIDIRNAKQSNIILLIFARTIRYEQKDYVVTKDFEKFFDGGTLGTALALHGYEVAWLKDKFDKLQKSVHVVIDGTHRVGMRD